jgi:putative transcriptional regulator
MEKEGSPLMTQTGYQYTESGLDNVRLANGFRYVDGPGGRHVLVIEDIDGLHRAIGRTLVQTKKDLTGKEIRFLRHEMLMSQLALASLLEVDEQTVARWEKGRTVIPKPAEALIRLLYREHTRSGPDNGKRPAIRDLLDHIAKLEEEIHGLQLRMKNHKWQPEPAKAA